MTSIVVQTVAEAVGTDMDGFLGIDWKQYCEVFHIWFYWTKIMTINLESPICPNFLKEILYSILYLINIGTLKYEENNFNFITGGFGN